MLVKDQLQIRMEQLNLKVPELARRVQVSNQTVRHWLAGRNLPGKSHLASLEKALGPNFKIDFTGSYETPIASRPPPIVAEPPPPAPRSMELQRRDAELFIMISQLPPDLKNRIFDLVELLSQRAFESSSKGSAGASVVGGVTLRHSTPRPHVATR